MPTRTLPTLALLPGILCNEDIFATTQAGLSDHAEIHIPDFFGFDSIEAMARHTLAQIQGSFSVVGFSLGGRVAMKVAELAPERVERICICASGAVPASSGDAEKQRPLLDLADEKGLSALEEPWLLPRLHPDRRQDRSLVQPLLDMMCTATPEIFAKQMQALLHRPDARPGLSRLRCPALVMSGAQDTGVAPAVTQAVAAEIPEAQAIIIGACGHFVPVEGPAEFVAAVRGWLDR
jgi:pimeloyl-ACP methyl ester carboxylesterase